MNCDFPEKERCFLNPVRFLLSKDEMGWEIGGNGKKNPKREQFYQKSWIYFVYTFPVNPT